MNGVDKKKRSVILVTKILGIDASTKCTGVAIVNTSGKLLFHDVIDYKNERDIDVRIDGMIEGLIKIFDEWCPDICYIEDSWNGATVLNVQTTKKLTNVIGAARCLCVGEGCLFNAVYPSTWRSAIGIDGGKGTKREEFKQRAMNWVEKRFNIIAPEDEAEAICIAYAGSIMNNRIFEEEEDLF